MVIETQSLEKFRLMNENGETPTFERATVDLKNFSTRFSQQNKQFSKQFFHVYACRLEELRGSLTENAHKKWGEDVKILKLSELEDLENSRCVIIGTMFKHQLWKPSILRELNEETQDSGVIPEKHENYCSDKDVPFLEDEMLRIKIVGPRVEISEIVTGIVVAVLGQKLEDGTFEVEDWCYPGCAPKGIRNDAVVDGKVVLVSGLDLAHHSGTLALEFLTEWITGMAGTLTAQEDISKIVNFIIAGNSVKTTASDCYTSTNGLMTNRAQESAEASEISSAVKKLDELLMNILEHCPVTLMPGQHDPTNLMLPQKPINRFMLKGAHKYENFRGVHNPWVATIGGRMFAGSSGQPIEDIMRVCGEASKTTPVEWLERTLLWRHYCPTAPDTLPSYPYHDKDLFIMQECPDVYFVGNCEKFESRMFKGENGEEVRVISVPKFSTTNTAVVLDLKTLDVNPIYFQNN
ncbi:DNA polymerase delta small subunit-like [Fopius arisanus]|uniref:DNA polymerase delta small subunit-like n=1 Tax=Fopius arisanus TaxID=64838 RepID=A0A9R1T7U7_9HYME|nr:PREDICTED: DNA polymerase delta small subunit-like [Fopius arisanus]